MNYYVTIINIGKNNKLLVKIKNDYNVNQKTLKDLKRDIIKAHQGKWVIMPDTIKWEKIC